MGEIKCRKFDFYRKIAGIHAALIGCEASCQSGEDRWLATRLVTARHSRVCWSVTSANFIFGISKAPDNIVIRGFFAFSSFVKNKFISNGKNSHKGT